MVSLMELWLPIVISGVLLFFASWMAWMILPHHKSDWAKLPDEDRFTQALRETNIQRGQYMFPHCPPEQRNDPEFAKRWQDGPCGTLTVFGKVNMGMNMVCSFLFFLVTSFCIAYLSKLELEAGGTFMERFRFIGTAGILTYCGGLVLNSIWFKRRLTTDLLDGIAYGLITGLVFALMWPAAPV